MIAFFLVEMLYCFSRSHVHLFFFGIFGIYTICAFYTIVGVYRRLKVLESIALFSPKKMSHRKHPQHEKILFRVEYYCCLFEFIEVKIGIGISFHTVTLVTIYSPSINWISLIRSNWSNRLAHELFVFLWQGPKGFHGALPVDALLFRLASRCWRKLLPEVVCFRHEWPCFGTWAPFTTTCSRGSF